MAVYVTGWDWRTEFQTPVGVNLTAMSVAFTFKQRGSKTQAYLIGQWAIGESNWLIQTIEEAGVWRLGFVCASAGWGTYYGFKTADAVSSTILGDGQLHRCVFVVYGLGTASAGMEIWVNGQRMPLSTWFTQGADYVPVGAYNVHVGGAVGDYSEVAMWSDRLPATDCYRYGMGYSPESLTKRGRLVYYPHRTKEEFKYDRWSRRVITHSASAFTAAHPKMLDEPRFIGTRPFRKKPTTVTAASVRGATRGARNLSEVLACNGGVLINRNSPQAKGLRLWYPTAAGKDSVIPDPVEGRHLRWLQAGATSIKHNAVAGPMLYTLGSSGSASNYARWEWENRGLPMRGRGLTISMWLRLQTYVSWDSVIYKAENTNNSGVWDWGILIHGSGANLWLIRNGQGPAAGPVAFPSNTLFHLVYTCDDTFSQHMIDGVAQASAGGIGTGDTSNVSTRGIYFGGNGFSPTMYVADLRVYDRRMSVPEMQAIYDPRTRFDLYAVPGGTTHVQNKTARRKVRYVDRRGARTLGEIL